MTRPESMLDDLYWRFQKPRGGHSVRHLVGARWTCSRKLDDGSSDRSEYATSVHWAWEL